MASKTARIQVCTQRHESRRTVSIVIQPTRLELVTIGIKSALSRTVRVRFRGAAAVKVLGFEFSVPISMEHEVPLLSVFTASLLVAFIVCLLALWLFIYLWRRSLGNLRDLRSSSQSRSTRYGQMTEQFMPFIPEYPWGPGPLPLHRLTSGWSPV